MKSDSLVVFKGFKLVYTLEMGIASIFLGVIFSDASARLWTNDKHGEVAEEESTRYDTSHEV